MNQENNKYAEEVIMAVGGQAVIEGVMMRSKDRIATAVRKQDGEIVVETKSYTSLVERHKWLNIPIIRGAITLVEVMIIGIKTLNFSADIAMADEAKSEGKERADGKGMSTIQALGTVTIALLFGLALFFAGPLWLTTWVFNIERDAFAFNLVAGTIRVAIFLAYLIGISYMADVKRLFEYHGSEHKSIFAFEERGSLDVADAREFTTLHPRCGTSFLAMVMMVSIIFFSLVDSLVLLYYGNISLLLRLAIHLPLVPVVGGIAYEAIKKSAKNPTNLLVRIFIAPGLALQKITTKEPDDSQLEVALAALKAALGEDWEEIVRHKKEYVTKLSA